MNTWTSTKYSVTLFILQLLVIYNRSIKYLLQLFLYFLQPNRFLKSHSEETNDCLLRVSDFSMTPPHPSYIKRSRSISSISWWCCSAPIPRALRCGCCGNGPSLDLCPLCELLRSLKTWLAPADSPQWWGRKLTPRNQWPQSDTLRNTPWWPLTRTRTTALTHTAY